MTVIDPHTGSPGHALSDREPPRAAATAPAPWGGLSPDEPPAGLGPWIPPLPQPEPRLSARAVTWFGVVAVAIIVAAAAAVAVAIGAATAPSLSRTDGLFLGSVRDNSQLSSTAASDADLIATGRDVCTALDERPSVSSVVAIMAELGAAQGWNDGDVAAVVGSAIGAYCPRHMALVGA